MLRYVDRAWVKCCCYWKCIVFKLETEMAFSNFRNWNSQKIGDTLVLDWIVQLQLQSFQMIKVLVLDFVKLCKNSKCLIYTMQHNKIIMELNSFWLVKHRCHRVPPRATMPENPLETAGLGITKHQYCTCTCTHTISCTWYFSNSERKTLQYLAHMRLGKSHTLIYTSGLPLQILAWGGGQVSPP